MLIRIKLILMSALWGGGFVSGRALAGRMDPMVASFLRYFSAAILLAIIVRIKNGRIPPLRKGQAVRVFILGLTGIALYSVLFFTGLHYVSAGKASLIVATNPIFTCLIAGIFMGEGLSPGRIAGICLSVCGAVLVISDGNPLLMLSGGITRGELLIFCCVAAWITYTLVGKAVVSKIPPLTAVMYAVFFGAGLLLVPALYNGLVPGLAAYSPGDWGNLLFLTVGGTVVGYLWFYEGVGTIGASRTAVFINLVPVFGVLLGSLLLNESVNVWLAGGGAMVIAGVLLTQQKTKSISGPPITSLEGRRTNIRTSEQSNGKDAS